MAETIWKFELTVGNNKIEMPEDCCTLSVACQGTQLFVWAIVVPSRQRTKRRFFVAMTGQTCNNNDLNGRFLGSAYCDGFVFHVFDHGDAA
jgi:hypothetical protein